MRVPRSFTEGVITFLLMIPIVIFYVIQWIIKWTIILVMELRRK